MTTFTYDKIIEYIDGTRDLNFEAAQKWAKEHGTTFTEDITKREFYEQEHTEEYFNPDTGETGSKVVTTPTIKRYWIIGKEPLSISREVDLQVKMRFVRDQYLRITQNKIDRYRNQKELGTQTTDNEQVYISLLEYTQYLRDYPQSSDTWYQSAPLDFDTWCSTIRARGEI